MTPAKPLRPIDVECPYCWACKGEECYVYRSPGGRDQNTRTPHAVRIRAAARAKAAGGEK